MKLCGIILFLTLGTLISAVVSCSSSEKPSHVNREKANDELSWDEAQERSRILNDVIYDLKISIDAKEDKFYGVLKTGFALKSVPKSLRIDFKGGEVKEIKINKTQVAKINYDGFAIYLDGNGLVEGLNIVEISYAHSYSTDGNGFHRFKDPEDGESYVYTDFEPFDANRFFPCFDQPDLKATMTMTVAAPASWQVLSTTLEQKKKNLAGGKREWIFPTTPKISTYLFSLIAGPFKVFKDNYGKTPLRLMVRKSLAKYVDASFWFKITKNGLGFFNDYFAYPYPFGKYDQVLVPEFNPGAMENVANVTFSERFITRAKPTRDHQLRKAEVILHEMAHMWFGNLATMRWWNDLWLNETFATYMSYLALAEATEFKEAWQKFNAGEKSWAYWEDQKITTHPIEAPVSTTSEATANFDGITYGKGAAVMRQLDFYIGSENFKAGVQNYIAKFSYKNTTLADFIGSLQEKTKEDLTPWTNVWLREAGVDSIAVNLDCKAGKVTGLALNLKSATSSLRPHALKLATFDVNNGKYEVSKVLDLKLKASKTEITELIGTKCPGMVFPNYGDYAYHKTYFDLATLDRISSDIKGISDPLVRLMVWQNLWQMVLDQKISAVKFMNVVKTQLPDESNMVNLIKILSFVIGTDWSSKEHLVYYLPRTNERATFITFLEGLFIKNLEASKLGSDEFKLWLSSLAKVAESPAGLATLNEYLRAEKAVDPDLRWVVLTRLCSQNYSTARELLEREAKKDKSDRGIRAAMMCSASFPDPKVKSEWMAKITNKNSGMPMAQIKSVMRNIFGPGQEQLAEPYLGTYFDVVANRQGTYDKFFVRTFSDYLMPARCTIENSERLDSFVRQNNNLDYPVKRGFLIGKEEELRCQAIRKLAADTISAGHE